MAKNDREGRNGGKLTTGGINNGVNPNAGRPRKGLNAVNADLKAQGYTPVTNADYVEANAYLLNLDEEGIQAIIADETMPMVMRIQARRIIDENRGFEALQVIADRAHGKATQRTEIAGPDGGAISFTLAPADPAQLAGLNIETNAD